MKRPASCRWGKTAALVCVVALFTSISWAADRNYKIATVAWIGWSPLHVAMEKGFWKDLDLNVEVIDYDDPIVIIEAIKAEKIDLAMDMAGSLVGIYMEGEPVVAIAETNWSHGGDKIVVRKGFQFQGNIGAPVGVFLDQPSCLFFLGRFLKEIHLNVSDFRIVEINPRDLSAQFVAGRLSAIVNYEPWVSVAVKKGDSAILATSADYTGVIPECIWGYKKTVQEIPDADIRNILKGWIKAVVWIGDPNHRQEYFDILRKRTFRNDPDLTDEDFSRMLHSVALHPPPILYSRNKNGGGLTQYLFSLQAFLRDNQMLKKDFAPADIFDNRWILSVLENYRGP